ncbi:MAG: 6-bladed beta-propeller [Bacteroidales bacterium]|jgi:hypothetical protein|nr:6-bladed beta-propeller [Bacteroidales bacterium]
MKSLSIPAIVIAPALVIALLSCNSVNNNKHPNTITTLNLEAAIDDVRDIRLSEIAGEIRHIPLETRPDALIGARSGQGIIPAGQYLLAPQARNPLMVFADDGRFIRSIGSIGRGPGEYSAEYYVVWCEASEHLFIKNNYGGNIYEYDLEGNFIKSFETEQQLLVFEALGNGMFVGALSLFFEADTLGYNYILFDNTGKTIEKYRIPGNAIVDLAGPGSPQRQALIVQPRILRTPDGVNIITNRNDTLFSVNKSGQFHPALTWEKGKYKPDFPSYLSTDKTIEGVTGFINIISITETSSFIFILYTLDGTQGRLLFNKKDGDIFRIGNVINDIDGTVPGMPGLIQYGNEITLMTGPQALKKNLLSGTYDSEAVKYPDRNRAFREMVESLTDNSNPVVTTIMFR